jgi:hypothetical protein
MDETNALQVKLNFTIQLQSSVGLENRGFYSHGAMPKVTS